MENRAERGDIIGIDSLFRRKLERRRARGRAELLYGGKTRRELDIEEDKDLKDTFFFKVPHKMDDTQNTELLWGLHEM